MKKQSLISVIIPVYNVEEYVEKTIQCIVAQDYKNIELILIDDCSTDSSSSIIDKFKSYKNIKIIRNTKNKGAAYSRNQGLQVATGDYIGFIDADDFIGVNYFSSLLDSATSENADIVICDINIVYDNGNVDRRSCGNPCHKKIDFINNGLAASSCNKLFKREYIGNTRYEETKKNEDLAFVLPLVISAEKVVYNKEVCYNYYQRGNSFQNSSLTIERFDIFDGVSLTLEKIHDLSDYEIYKEAIVYNQLIVFLLYVIEKETSIRKRYQYLKKYHNLSKKYKINKNTYFKEFLSNHRKLYRIYYQLLVELNSRGLIVLDSFLMTLYKIYKSRDLKVTKNDISLDDIIACAKMQNKKVLKKKVSVVVPNYNYSRFLYERIYSILNQNYKIYELIILDDCSTDDSRDVIDKIENAIKSYMIIKKVYNKKNSGRAFIQWEKGFQLATGDYVWIAEADDYCKETFLMNVMKKNEEEIISYTDTGFIDSGGNLLLKSIKKEIDVQDSGHWNKSYLNDGKNEFQKYTYLNCTIANVSSIVFKNDDYAKEFEIAKKFKQVGDWIFYASLMQRGKIRYINKVLNYYRVHGNNVTSMTKKQDHLNEITEVHNYFDKIFKLSKEQKERIEKRYCFLKNVWGLEDER